MNEPMKIIRKARPSEEIQKLFLRIRDEHPKNRNADKVEAIIQFLDKQSGFPI